jgi:hypothetical protein
MGVASASAERSEVHKLLVENIIEWDNRSIAKSVRKRIETTTFEPEIRTVSFSTNQVRSTTSQRAATPTTIGFAGANSVPVVSPAAASLTGGGVVAIRNNTRATSILGQTGSTGLGTSGRRLLTAPPGVRPGG